MSEKKRYYFLVLGLFFFLNFSFSAQAAIFVDDIYTTDKGHFDLELSCDYYKDVEKEYDPEAEEHIKTKTKETDLNFYLSYGLLSNWDVGVTIPYIFLDDSEFGKNDGLSDITIETKYRFWEEKNFLPGFALYLDFKTDSGDDDKGLGTGKREYTINNIFTKTFGKNVVDLNLGYIFIEKEDDAFFCILDYARTLTDKLNLCLELYGETNFSGDFDDNIFISAFSFSYQLNERISFEFGPAFGISQASPDYQISAKLTLTF